jgi:hypothetical protein
MLIIVVTPIWGKGMSFFCISKFFFLEIVGIGPFMMECELRVYRQEEEEFERITRIYFVRN